MIWSFIECNLELVSPSTLADKKLIQGYIIDTCATFVQISVLTPQT